MDILGVDTPEKNVMLKEFKYLIFLIVIFFFIFFTLRYYFSDQNKKIHTHLLIKLIKKLRNR